MALDKTKVKKNGGVMTRIGERFYKEVERIKDKRLLQRRLNGERGVGPR